MDSREMGILTGYVIIGNKSTSHFLSVMVRAMWFCQKGERSFYRGGMLPDIFINKGIE